MKVGIVGAGKLGTALARRSVAKGHEVLLATRPGTRDPGLVVEVMAPGSVALPAQQWGTVDLAVLAVPFHVALTVDLPLPRGTVVIDPTNHWEPVDGPAPDLGGRGTTEAIAAGHPGLLWVKSLNQLGYHDLDDLTDLAGLPMRYATDHDAARDTVADYLSSLGLRPIHTGPLASGAAFEPGTAVFDATATVGNSAPDTIAGAFASKTL